MLDFSACEAAFLNGMIAILASVDSRRRDSVDVEIVLPVREELKRLFHNANWAHFIDPSRYDASDVHYDRHVAAHRFKTADDQQQLVNSYMDVVMRQITLERDVIAGLEWSINEITDNVLNHAQSPDGGIVQVSTFRQARNIAFGVADAGQGILSSLREGHPYLKSDAQAIGEAVKGGVTRNPDVGQGNGLAGSLRIATMSGGSIEITSGRAQLVVRGSESRTHERAESMRVPGTVVYVVLGLDRRFHISEALGFSGEPTNRSTLSKRHIRPIRATPHYFAFAMSRVVSDRGLSGGRFAKSASIF